MQNSHLTECVQGQLILESKEPRAVLKEIWATSSHNKKSLSVCSRNIAYRRSHSIVFSKFEILNSAFANFYLFSVLDFSGLIMSV